MKPVFADTSYYLALLRTRTSGKTRLLLLPLEHEERKSGLILRLECRGPGVTYFAVHDLQAVIFQLIDPQTHVAIHVEVNFLGGLVHMEREFAFGGAILVFDSEIVACENQR